MLFEFYYFNILNILIEFKRQTMNKIQKSIILFICGILTMSFSSSAQNDFAKSAISIGVVVEDLDKTLEFYQNVVGMVKVSEFAVDSEKAKKMGLSDGERFDVTVLKLENNETATELKLMSFNKKTSSKNRNYIPDENGIRYITIFIKSMTPLLERIKKHSVKTLGETPTMLDAERQFVLIQDPDGNFVEFIGPK
jgi:catechol 2,3-dioxygenase-like lactoylglutathione lyase family enzyme